MSKFIKSTLTGFNAFNIYQKISVCVLALTVPLIIALSVSAITGPEEINTSGLPQTDVVDKIEESSEASSLESSSSEEVKKDVKVTLYSSSVEEDLEVQILDESGNMIVGPNFVLNVKSDETNYNKDWEVNDGFLKLTKLTAGKYTVSIEELEGHIMPDSIEVEVQEKVAYEEQDVSDKVVDESDIDASTEDNDYGSSSGGSATPPPVVDTVEYIATSTAKKEVDVEVEVTYYKPVLADDGSIALADGTSSGLYPVYDENNYLTGAYKKTIEASEMSLNYYSVYPKNLTYNLTTLNIIGVNEGTGTENGATPTPTAEPTQAPTAEPTLEPTQAPTMEPTQAPTIAPTNSAAPTPTNTQTPTTSETPQSTSSPAPTATASPTPAPTASPNVVQTPVEIFDADGNLKDEYNLKLEEVKVKETETKEVTYYYGWQTISGKKYYYDKDGKKVTGTQIIQGVSYVFDNDGVLQEGEIIGIDVSKWQNNIDWNVVKNSGVDWVIIRVGYRGYSTGKIVEDVLLHSHITGAKNAGLKVGLYFFSQAITTQEAVEEASFAIQKARQYGINLPIFFDSEYSTSAKTGRADYLSQSHRTSIAKAFCETVENAGFQAGIYASKSWFYYNLDYSQISQYDIWVAHYTSATDFKYRYEIWQYTGTGTWPGVAGHVDINIAYKHY